MKISLKGSKEEFLKEISKFAEGGQYISESGLYKVAIKQAVITTTKTGSKKLSLNVVKDGATADSIVNVGVIYKADGSENAAAHNKLLSLLEIFGLKEVATKATKIKGFDGNEYEAEEIKELAGKSLIILVQKEYSKYDGKIYRNFMLQDAFRLQDKANTIEILNNKDLGKRYAYLVANQDKAIKDRYNGVTEQEVEAYYAAKAKEKAETKEVNGDSFEADDEELPF